MANIYNFQLTNNRASAKIPRMDTTDIYTSRQLLYKCDNSISKVYTNLIKILSDPSGTIDQSIRNQTIKQLDVIIFQIFKYKTALHSLQKDIKFNQQQQIQADKQIERSKAQIKLLTEDVKSAEIVRKRKLQYNEIAKSVKEFDTNQQLNQKIKTVETQVEKLQNQYKMDMQAYAEKQRCLRIALSALRVLMREDGVAGNGQSPVNNF